MNALATLLAAVHTAGLLTLVIVIVLALLLAGLTYWALSHFPRLPVFVAGLAALLVFVIVLAFGLG